MNLELSNKLNVSSIRTAYQRKRYDFGIGSGFMNIWGVRADNELTNAFTDIGGFIIYDGQNYTFRKYEFTTKPGTIAFLKPKNPKGTGIVVPGFYKDVWEIGLHNNQYEAFVQRGIFRVYRDNNKNSHIDLDPITIESGNNFGINCHHAGQHSTQVDNWSYACQVLAVLNDFNEMLSFGKEHLSIYGISNKRFSYALFEEKDFV